MFRTIGIILVLLATSASAEGIYKYVDETGNAHFVTDVKRVPEQFRNQVESTAALPPISRLGAAAPSAAVTADRDRRLLQDRQPKSDITGSNSQTVELFVTSWCGYCRQLEQFLTAQRIRFKRYDIEATSSNRKKYEALGVTGIPVTRIGKQIIHGYQPDQILAALKRKRSV